jgi:hypothetical protein
MAAPYQSSSAALLPDSGAAWPLPNLTGPDLAAPGAARSCAAQAWLRRRELDYAAASLTAPPQRMRCPP